MWEAGGGGFSIEGTGILSCLQSKYLVLFRRLRSGDAEALRREDVLAVWRKRSVSRMKNFKLKFRTPGKFLRNWMSPKHHFREAKNTSSISMFPERSIFLAQDRQLLTRFLCGSSMPHFNFLWRSGSEADSKLFYRLERTSGEVEQESRSVPNNSYSDDVEFERKLNIMAARFQNQHEYDFCALKNESCERDELQDCIWYDFESLRTCPICC